MAKSNKADMINAMKRNTDNVFYLNLVEYITTRILEIQCQLVVETDMDEVPRLQGRAKELDEFLKALSRKQIVKQPTGAFNA